MPRPRNRKTAIAHILTHSERPIYVLDTSNRVLFANDACGKWLNTKPEEILGEQCHPSTVPLANASEDRLRGLVPTLSSSSAASVSFGSVFGPGPESNIDHRPAVVIAVSALESKFDERIVFVLPAGEQLEFSTGPDQSRPDPHLEIRKLIADIAIEHRQFHDLSGLVGKHPLTFRLRRQIEAAGSAECDVAVVGRACTQPDRIARTIYNLRFPDASQPPLQIDCRLADQQQIQDAIGQIFKRPAGGRRESATLLLTCTDLLPASGQFELLGFLRLPGERIRILSTAEQPLLDLASRGEFDFELAARLTSMQIDVPVLADRKCDLPVIATQLVDQIQSQSGGQTRTLSATCLQLLEEYHWPGDLEQLIDVLRQAIATCPNQVVGPEHLPEVVRFGIQAQRFGRQPSIEINLDQYLARIETLLLERALQQAKGNKSAAAKLLGVTRSRLIRRCEQLSLAIPGEPIDFQPDDRRAGESDGPDKFDEDDSR